MGRALHYRTLASLRRIALLHELQRRGSLTVAQLAAATGLHHNTAREHLHRLIDAGFVASDPAPAEGRGRPELLYRTRLDADDTARGRRLRDALEHGELLRRLAGTGHRMRGPAGRQLDVLEEHLDDCGIEASVDGTADNSTTDNSPDDGVEGQVRSLGLHECPFAELARKHPQVCEVHFGLVREVLRQADGPLDAEGLHPLEDTGRCTLDLRQRA